MTSIKWIAGKLLPCALALLTLAGCASIVHDREDQYLRQRRQGMPLNSDIIVECRANEAFEGVPFMVSYNLLLDVTPYPDRPENRKTRDDWCTTGVRSHYLDEKTGERLYWRHDWGRGEDITGGNRDLAKGATRSWDLSGVRMDGASWHGHIVDFWADIIDGDRLPLGGLFNVFHLKQYRTKLLEPPRTFTANGLKWKQEAWQEIWWGGGTGIAATPNGTVDGLLEIYQAKVGGYSILVYGSFSKDVIQDANWLSQRRALLRSWVESFKVSALPKDRTGIVFVPGNQRDAGKPQSHPPIGPRKR